MPYLHPHCRPLVAHSALINPSSVESGEEMERSVCVCVRACMRACMRACVCACRGVAKGWEQDTFFRCSIFQRENQRPRLIGDRGEPCLSAALGDAALQVSEARSEGSEGSEMSEGQQLSH